MKGLFSLFATGVLLSAAVSLAEDTPSQELIGPFRNTYYYVVLESDYAQLPADTVVLNLKGEEMARVSSSFKKAMDIEGTGKLQDGRVLNFDGVVNKEIRYRWVSAAWGMGVGACQLVPFHTIAVDPREIPLGSLVKIDETVGMKLPDGTLHDGFWRAEDIGGAIKQDRIDLFVGTYRDGRTVLQNAGISNLKPLTVRLVEKPAPDSCAFRALE